MSRCSASLRMRRYWAQTGGSLSPLQRSESVTSITLACGKKDRKTKTEVGSNYIFLFKIKMYILRGTSSRCREASIEVQLPKGPGSSARQPAPLWHLHGTWNTSGNWHPLKLYIHFIFLKKEKERKYIERRINKKRNVHHQRLLW